jgi:hypothetical protein
MEVHNYLRRLAVYGGGAKGDHGNETGGGMGREEEDLDRDE